MSLIQMTVFSKEILKNTNVLVVYPQNLIKEDMKVLFLLHGAYGNEADWHRFSNIERLANEYKVMVVMPNADMSYYTNMVKGANYFNYIGYELREIIQDIFNFKLKKEHTYIAGLSMGGYGAFKFAFTNPEFYQGTASLSGAMDIQMIYNNYRSVNSYLEAVFGTKEDLIKNLETNDLYSLSKNNDLSKLDIYLACGKEDFLYKDNVSFKKHLEKLNIKHHYQESKGDHNWEYWDLWIKDVFAHFFRK